MFNITKLERESNSLCVDTYFNVHFDDGINTKGFDVRFHIKYLKDESVYILKSAVCDTQNIGNFVFTVNNSVNREYDILFIKFKVNNETRLFNITMKKD